MSFWFQNGPKGCFLTFLQHLWYVCSVMYATNTGQVLKPVMSQCLFSKDSKTLTWIHHELMHESKIPFPTMFITSSLLLLILKLKEYQDYLVTGKMFAPVNKTFIRDLYNSWPHSMWAFNAWMCKRKRCQITVKLSRGGCYTNLYGNDSLFFLPLL